MQLGKVGRQVALATGPGKMIAGLAMLGHWVLGWFVMSIVVFLRRDFGTRYLGWCNILFGMTAVGFFTGLGNIVLSQGEKHVSWAIELAYFGVVVLSVYHRFVISRKRKKGILFHSQNPGTSLIRIPGVSEEAVAKWVEPFLLFGLAYLAGKFHDAPLRIWLNISGFALLVHEQISSFMQEQMILDALDAMIESRNIGAVMSGKPASQTAGYTIAKSNLEVLNRNPEIKDAFMGLSPDVKGIMDKEAA